MNIDTSGTTPGLAKDSETPVIVSMRCKANKCESLSFQQVSVEGPSHQGIRVYRCIKCGDVVTISVGGSFAL